MNLLASNQSIHGILFFLILGFYNSLPLLSQNTTSSFDSLYLDIAINVMETDSEKAISMADSLFHHSKSSIHKMKSALLLALLHENNGDAPEALKWAILTEDIALKENNYEYQVRSAGYLATLFRRVNLINESEKHVKIAEKANSKRKSAPNYDAIQALIHHEKYYHKIDENDYEKAISELDNYKKYLFKSIDTTSHSSILSRASMYESYAECYIYMEEYEKARKSVENSFRIISDSDPQLVCLLNNHLGVIELHYKNYEEAFKHLEKAKEYADESQNISIQFPTYRHLARYYKATEDFENAVIFADKADQAKEKHTESIKKVSNTVLAKLYEDKNNAKKVNLYLIWISTLLLVSVLCIVLIARKKLKHQRRKYKESIKRIEATKEKKKTSVVKNKVEVKKDHQNGYAITTETAERILQQLENLENEKFFLNKDITLASLTSQLNSNTRYVSQLIKTQKGADFNGYINELRVLHAIQLWQENPEFLKYKLSYIADHVGFASHSRFSVVFKSITGLSPSAFLTEMKKEKDKQE